MNSLNPTINSLGYSNLYNFQSGATQVDVGTYSLHDDIGNFVDPFQLVDKVQATKIRIDSGVSPYEVVSIHYFIIQGEDLQQLFLPGISAANFYRDFNCPTKEEVESVKDMLAELNQYGLGAFLCNDSHHAIIF